jgi:hypothetical protein
MKKKKKKRKTHKFSFLKNEKEELTSNLRARISSCIYSRRWPSRPSVGREAPWYCKLYMPKYRGLPGPRSGRGGQGSRVRRV